MYRICEDEWSRYVREDVRLGRDEGVREKQSIERRGRNKDDHFPL